jgi:acyl-CoA reductase-like NAD-dependent aldehyde dehydrogenase
MRQEQEILWNKRYTPSRTLSDKKILGPLVDKIQYEHVMKFIEEGKKAGSEVVTGGSRLGDKGYFVQPTIFRNVPLRLSILL